MSNVRFTPPPFSAATSTPYNATVSTPYAAATSMPSSRPLPPPRPQPVVNTPWPQDAYVDTSAFPVDGAPTGLMSSEQFLNAVDQFTDQAVILSNAHRSPPDSAVRKMAVTKVTGSTVNGLLLGAPNRFKRALRAPSGSPERREAYVNGGVRGVAAVALMSTIFVPVVSGIVGYARGQKAVSSRGMQRLYQRSMLKKNVLEPMLKLLKNEAPIPLGVEHRARVRAFLDVCENNPSVKAALKQNDTQKIEKWLSAADRI